MFGLSNFLARQLWYGMLWFMRRPAVRSARRNFPNLFPESQRARIWENIKSQDRWAMRHGRKMLAFTFNLLFLSVILSFLFVAALEMYNQGAFTFLEGNPAKPMRQVPVAAPQ